MFTPQSCSKPNFSAPAASRLLLFQLFMLPLWLRYEAKSCLKFQICNHFGFLPESQFFQIFAIFLQKKDDGINFAKLKNELEIPWLIRLSCLMTGFITIQLHFYATLAYFVYFWYCVTTSVTWYEPSHKTQDFSIPVLWLNSSNV